MHCMNLKWHDMMYKPSQHHPLSLLFCYPGHFLSLRASNLHRQWRAIGMDVYINQVYYLRFNLLIERSLSI